MFNSQLSVRITSLYGSLLSSVVSSCKTATFGPEQQFSMGLRYYLSFCARKTAWLAQESLVSVCSTSHLWFLHGKQWLLDPITSLYVYYILSVVLCMQNSAISTRITCLYGSLPSCVVFGCKTARITSLYESQTSPVVLCSQNSAISTWNTSLYGSLPSSAVFAWTIGTLGPELQVSMGPRPHLSFCACKTAYLASELLVSTGPCPHLWFLPTKQRLLDQICKSLWVPSSVVLSTLNSVLSTRVSRLYGFQPSPVVLCFQNSDFRTRITSLWGSQTPPVVFPCKTASSGTE